MSKQSNDWDDIFEQYKASGLTQPAFCKAHGLTDNQFQYRWYKKNVALKARARAISLASASTKHSFEPVIIGMSPIPSNSINNTIELSVHLPNKIRCDIKMDLCTDAFSALLKQLVNAC